MRGRGGRGGWETGEKRGGGGAVAGRSVGGFVAMTTAVADYRRGEGGIGLQVFKCDSEVATETPVAVAWHGGGGGGRSLSGTLQVRDSSE